MFSCSVLSLQNLLGPATRAEFELLHELANADDDDDDDWDVVYLNMAEVVVDELIATPENLDGFDELLLAGPGRLL
jgi:hypothetical protein